MSFADRLIAVIDCYTEWCGRTLAWLTVFIVAFTVLVVVLRYGFDIGAVALQEVVTYLHASVFLLGAAYALKHSAHVRVDIFYRRYRPRTRAWIDSLGCLIFLLPLCVYIFITSWEFAAASWAVREHSIDAAGLPYVYVLKSMLPLMALNLALQGIAELGRNVQLLIAEPAPERAAHAD